MGMGIIPRGRGGWGRWRGIQYPENIFPTLKSLNFELIAHMHS